ncbi:acyl-CoA dehydrogenase family protein [Cellulomonas denverensis]|uniref:Acyl-CoA dehydrogenase n=1 Tax=Cellulomonas denverensis TaxID=264297 RepID=A0A7X6KWS2_9CELL|nr:acyl-CoA dehydrogenase family protein [Cellulomonas denverensis]NKY23669.1 acyl-CoA dehydrogenase [Cellulomonas denverensis]GIG26850.1 acyl-CoA dehydrogenase [Cellulomonas denverensis]
MALIYTEEQSELIAMVREFVTKEIQPKIADCDRAGECPADFYDSAFEMGLHMLEIPEEFGGGGLDFETTAMVFEELGKVDAGYAITLVSTFVALRNVILAGTPEQAKLFADLVAPGGLGAFVLSEPGAGSDAAAIRTTAVRDGDEWVLNGTKTWITNGGISKVYAVLAKTDPDAGHRGISCFIVETDRPGVSWGHHEDKCGLRTSNTCDVVFDEVRVPADHLVGEPGGGFKICMTGLNLSRAFMATICVGMMQRALDEAVRYASERRQFGEPIIHFQLVQKLLADMAAQTEAARCLVNNTMRLMDAGLPVAKEGAITKMLVTDMLQDVASKAVQVFGGNGYTKEYPVEKIFRDAKVFQIMEGTNEIQALVIGKALEREYAV